MWVEGLQTVISSAAPVIACSGEVVGAGAADWGSLKGRVRAQWLTIGASFPPSPLHRCLNDVGLLLLSENSLAPSRSCPINRLTWIRRSAPFATISWSVLRPHTASMATLALNSGSGAAFEHRRETPLKVGALTVRY